MTGIIYDDVIGLTNKDSGRVQSRRVWTVAWHNRKASAESSRTIASECHNSFAEFEPQPTTE